MEKYNEVFEVQKDGKGWKVIHIKTDSVVCRAKNKKEVLYLADKILTDKGESKTLKAIKYLKAKRIKNKFFNDIRIQRLFKNTFGEELYKFRDYLMYLLSSSYCIDIVRLDKRIGTPSGVSCKEYIKSKYGDRALKLVTKLM